MISIKYIIGLFVILIVVFLIYDKTTKKYINPYKLYFIMGKKGSGKSTFLTRIALENIKRGKRVYTTEDINGTYKISGSDIGSFEFPENSVLLLDEVSLIWNNRDWKSLKPEVIEWFRYQRKRRLIVYLFSQTFDVDVKIRDLSDEMYLVRKYFRVLSVARRIDKNITIKNGSAEAPSTLSEDFEFVPILSPNSIKVTFIPKYTADFVSFNPPPLKYKIFHYTGVCAESDGTDSGVSCRGSQAPKGLRKTFREFWDSDKE